MKSGLIVWVDFRDLNSQFDNDCINDFFDDENDNFVEQSEHFITEVVESPDAQNEANNDSRNASPLENEHNLLVAVVFFICEASSWRVET